MPSSTAYAWEGGSKSGLGPKAARNRSARDGGRSFVICDDGTRRAGSQIAIMHMSRAAVMVAGELAVAVHRIVLDCFHDGNCVGRRVPVITPRD